MSRNHVTILQEMADNLAISAETQNVLMANYAGLMNTPVGNDPMDLRRRRIYLDARDQRRRLLEQEAAIHAVLAMLT